MHEEARVLPFEIQFLWDADASICQAFDEPLLLSCNPGPGVVSPLPGGAVKHDAEMWQALLHFLGQILQIPWVCQKDAATIETHIAKMDFSKALQCRAESECRLCRVALHLMYCRGIPGGGISPLARCRAAIAQQAPDLAQRLLWRSQ